jgi:crotonobetainyl-CoA:carnitine CoA-transferase CaiB-like acyl-CoA transferase
VEGWLCSLESREAALDLLAKERISAGPVLSHEEMLTHPFFKQRGTFGKVQYPGLGEVGVIQPPFKFSGADAYVRGRAPEMGEHTREILSQLLDMNENEVEALMADNVLTESGGAKQRQREAIGVS